MDVGKYVKSFIKDYKITGLDRGLLEDVIAKLGYRIIKFNPVFNDKSVDEIITSLALEDAIKHNQSFTFGNKVFKCVFIRDDISDKDSIPIMLHEIGHIYMGHIKQGLVENDVRLENEANQFAHLTSQAIEKAAKKDKIISVLVCLMIFILMMVAIFVEIKLNHNSQAENSDFLNNSSITVETESPATESQIKATSSESDDDVYYITSGGTKYHKEFCTAIQNKTNVYQGTKEDLEQMGYEPCQLCIGER